MKRVFIIDDHLQVRRNYGLLIEREPSLALCGEASSAEEALLLIPECNPDIVVLDVSLKGTTDGLQLLHHLQSRWNAMQVLVVSGYEEKMYAQMARQNGAQDYIVKGNATLFLEALRKLALADNPHSN